MAESNARYDVIITGAGPVGAGLALALDGVGYRVALLEAVPFRADEQPSYDERSLALAWASRRILAAIDPQLWDDIAEGATPIHRIHVSDRGHFGRSVIDRAEQAVPALGYVVESRLLGRALETALARSGVELFCPARVTAIDLAEGRARVLAEGEGGARIDLEGALLVAADGAGSTVRTLAGIDVRRREYGQTAVIANVTPARAHDRIAYERFTDSGPLALLPLSRGRCSLVWTCRDGEETELLELDDGAFLRRLGERFGGRLGGFRAVGQRNAYPLGLQYARRFSDQRLLILGNAAHVLHPVAGQGYNLGLRDAAVLAELLSGAAKPGDRSAAGHRGGRLPDPGAPLLLRQYVEARRTDYARTTAFTDGLVRIFSSTRPPLPQLRGAGLLALDALPPARSALARQAMGLGGRVPRLARGLHL